jgi:hypothetical protein
MAQDGDVQIAEIARNEEGDDLPRTVGQRVVTRRPAFEDDMDVIRPLAFGQDVLLCLNDPLIVAEGHELFDVGLLNGADRGELSNERGVPHCYPPPESGSSGAYTPDAD